MNDLISRQEAIDAIIAETYMDGAYGYADCKDLVDTLENLPSAQPEQKKGKWVYDSESYPLGNPAGYYNCNQCGESVLCKSNYCPNCGADMRGDEDD